MDYWAETMQDDVYLIVQRRLASASWHRTASRNKPTCMSSRVALIVARYFAAEQAAIEQAGSRARRHRAARWKNWTRNTAARKACWPRPRTTRASSPRPASRRGCKEIKGDTDAADERKVLEDYLALVEKEADASKTGEGRAEGAGWPRSRRKYGKLTEDEIKTLVVDDKWLATLAAAVQGELDRVSQTLTGRIRQLAERYATPLPQLTDEVATLAARVDEHLKKMGAVWK